MKLCPNGLHKTYLVSFPRSGHHLMVRGLTEALDHKLVYSEYYTCVHNMEHCQFVNLQKSHDFDLQLPIEPDLNYIVLYRDFDQAVQSWYKAEAHLEDFDTFKESKREYWANFLQKWVMQKHDNVHPFQYNRLVKFKQLTVLEAAMTINPKYPPRHIHQKLWDWADKEDMVRILK